MSKTLLDDRDILGTCALRFDGYKFQDNHPDFDPRTFIEKTLEPGEWQASELELLATFFFLQRALGKWDLVYEPVHGQYWQAYRKLFLQACRIEIPPEYQLKNPVWRKRWSEKYQPDLQAFIEIVENNFSTYAALGDNDPIPSSFYPPADPK